MEPTTTPAPTTRSTAVLSPDSQSGPKPLPLNLILTVIALASLLLIGYLIFQNQQLQRKLDQITQIQITPTPQILVPPTDPTTNWKTYTSPRFNYSFSYPSEWFFSPWNEAEPKVLHGSHTLSNYDPNMAEKYMTKGVVDWNSFMNGKDVVKIDISSLDSPESIIQFGGELKKSIQLPGEEVVIVAQRLPVYHLKGIGAGPALDIVQIDIPVKADLHLVLNIFGFRLQNKDLLKSPVWPTIKQILSTFKFTEDGFCGGIAGIPCPSGYKCLLDGNYPDAGGKCQK